MSESEEDWDKDLGLGKGDDDNWDDDFASPHKPKAPLALKLNLGGGNNAGLSASSQASDVNNNSSGSAPPPVQHQLLLPEDDEFEDDWSHDFSEDTSLAMSSKPLKITGIQADPSQIEGDWDKDFDFGDAPAFGGKTKAANNANAFSNNRQLKLTRQVSLSLLTSTERTEAVLKDLLHHQFPDMKEGSGKKSSTPSRPPVKRRLTKDFLAEVEIKDKKVASAHAKNDKSEESKAIWELGMLYYNEGNYADALKHLKKAYTLLQAVPPSHRDAGFESQLLLQMGVSIKEIADVYDAINTFKLALECLHHQKETLNYASRVSTLHAHLGRCHVATENWALAALSLGDSLKAAFSLPVSEYDWAEIGKICSQIGTCCKQLSLPDLSKEYLKKALELSQSSGDTATNTAVAAQLQLLRGGQPDTSENSESEFSATELDDEDDWDAEFGIDNSQRQHLKLDAPVSHGLKAMFVQVSSDKGAEVIPLRYKLLEALKHEVEIIKYPKATPFYSIKYEGGRMNEANLEKWLSRIVSKHTPDLVHTKLGPMQKPQLEVKQQWLASIQSAKRFTPSWAKLHLDFLHRLCLLRKNDLQELFWHIAHDYSVDMKDYIKYKTDKDHELFMYYLLRTVYLCSKEAKAEEEKKVLKNFLDAIRKFDIRYGDLVALIEAETAVHHQHDKLSDKEKLSYAELFASIANKLKVNKQLPANSENEELVSETTDNELKTRAIVDLYFMLDNMSPLTGVQWDYAGNLEDEEDENDDSSEKHSRAGSEYNETTLEMLNLDNKMNELMELYQLLRPSFLRARAAFALGQHAENSLGNLPLAEKLFFECLYILDSIKPATEGLPAIVSELGTNALIRYGEVLLVNFKYQYAIVSFESAILDYKLRKKESNLPLIRRLATITKEHDDYKRSIEYFREVLDAYCREGKANEIRYVSEVISGLYLESGDFRKAENYLQNALSAVPQNMTASEKVDPISFRLQMKLADLYLSSYNYERGIELLETLHLSYRLLPHGSRSQILIKLAKAFIKKRWFHDCHEILRLLEEDLLGVPGTAAHPHGQVKAGLGAIESKLPPALDKRTLKLWELRGLCFYHSCQFAHALYCIDTAIGICPPTSLSSLAHYYYQRGKIFQQLCLSSTSVQFPTALKPQGDGFAVLPAKQHSTKIYTCTGDLIQECVSSFDKAYNYFRAIGDDIHIAKTVNNIAQTYLDRVFAPVALLHFPFSDLSRLPAFEVSELARSPPQKETRHRRTKSMGEDLHVGDGHAKDFVITMEKIENPSICALDIGADICHPLLICSCYLNMAELRYLQEEPDAAVSFWTECKEQLLQLFLDESSFLGKGSPPGFLKKMCQLFKRLTRFMFCFDADFINKNLVVIEAYLALQLDQEQSQRRPVRSFRYEVVDDDEAARNEGPGRSVSLNRPNLLKTNTSTAAFSTYPPTGLLGSALGGALGIKPAPTGPRVSVTSVFDSEQEAPDRSKMLHEQHLAGAMGDTASKINEINEECAARIWGFLYSMKATIHNYVKGKLTQEELLNRNRKTLRKILQVKRANEMMKQQTMSGASDLSAGKRPRESMIMKKSPSTGSSSANAALKIPPTYEELLQSNPNIARLIYVLQVDDYLIYYVPNSAQKRIQRLGGKEENLKANILAPTTVLYLSIHLLANTEECVMLVVSPNMSLDKILKYLCNKPYWESEDQKKKKFFGSFGRSHSAPGMKKPKFVDRTKEFHSGLAGLLSLLGYDTSVSSQDNLSSPTPSSTPSDSNTSSGNITRTASQRHLSSSELSRISFAKKTINQLDSSSAFVPLTVSSHTTVAQCFTPQEAQESSAENPLQLFLFLSSSYSATQLTAGGASQKDFLNKTIYLTQDMLSYLSSLLLPQAADNAEQAKKVIMEMSDSVFSTLIDIIPESPSGDQSPLGAWVNLGKVASDSLPPVPSMPLSLVCSKVLHLFPWELMLGQIVARYLSLHDLMNAWKTRSTIKKNSAEGNALPKYFSCYFSGGDKHLVPMEEQRREWLSEDIFHQLNLRTKLPSTIRYSGVLSPFHSPLVKYGKKITAYKRQYKYIHWFDLGVVGGAQDLVRLVDNVSLTHYPVFLLTYADLLELSETLLYLIRYRPHCTFVFIPASKMKTVVTKLMKIHEDYLKPTPKSSSSGSLKAGQSHSTPLQSCYQFLMSALAQLQVEQAIPIACFNPV